MARQTKDQQARNVCERAILEEWDRWSKDQTNPLHLRDGMYFFNYLQREKPLLLEFPYPGDKWQAVHGMLIHGRRLKDLST